MSLSNATWTRLALEKVAGQHHEHGKRWVAVTSALDALPDDGKSADDSRKALAAAINEFGDWFIKHNTEEEQVIRPLVCANMDVDKQRQVGMSIAEYGKATTESKLSLLLFRDIASSDPKEYEYYCSSFPWVLRSVVIPGLALASSSYAEYLAIFGKLF